MNGDHSDIRVLTLTCPTRRVCGLSKYGRGGVVDGYAGYSWVGASQALEDQGAPHARCMVLIEASEESGSYELPAYVDHLADRIGKQSLVVCLDSGCGN